MTEEMKQEKAQDNQSNMVENKPESPSNDGLLPEVMAKKETIKALKAELAERNAEDEKRRVKKLEEEGKYKDLISELQSKNDNLNAKLESQAGIVTNYKSTLINNITTDKERIEILQTKSVDFLEELNKEKVALQPQSVANPKESLGAVRSHLENKKYSEMSKDERRAWHEQTFNK
jgi:hypothetical protein